jgi:hypothetical protein
MHASHQFFHSFLHPHFLSVHASILPPSIYSPHMSSSLLLHLPPPLPIFLLLLPLHCSDMHSCVLSVWRRLKSASFSFGKRFLQLLQIFILGLLSVEVTHPFWNNSYISCNIFCVLLVRDCSNKQPISCSSQSVSYLLLKQKFMLYPPSIILILYCTTLHCHYTMLHNTT